MRASIAGCAAVLGGCAGQVLEPPGLVDNPVYFAAGPPGWQVEIGDDVVLRLRHALFDGDIAYIDYRFRRRAPARAWDGVRRWRAGDGSRGIMVEAQRRRCVSAGGTVYEDQVRVVGRGRRLKGCGGRVLSEGNG